MTRSSTSTLTSAGLPLDTSPGAFGWLRDSTDALNDPAELQTRMARDGYLYLPRFFPQEQVLPVRSRICAILAEEGALDTRHPIVDAVAATERSSGFRPDIANGRARDVLEPLVYGPRIMAFYETLLSAPARHYDYTWLRAMPPGHGLWPHCDAVFMGRGTPDVYTAWIPLGDIPLDVGGLAVIEGSHRDVALQRTYAQLDVDTSCDTDPSRNQLAAAGYLQDGGISVDLPAVRHALNRRLLTAEQYSIGDLLTFTIHTVHASLDNRSATIRLSSDTRYQRAADPIDPRWTGADPPGHGGASVHPALC